MDWKKVATAAQVEGEVKRLIEERHGRKKRKDYFQIQSEPTRRKTKLMSKKERSEEKTQKNVYQFSRLKAQFLDKRIN
jgi:hypothetical protein